MDFSIRQKAKDFLSSWKSWLVPGLTIGASMYVKSKQSAKLRWFFGTEDEAKSTAIALFLARLQSGLTLPSPTQGFHWKPIKMTLATSLFSGATDMTVNVLEADPLVTFGGAPVAAAGAVTASGVQGFGATPGMADQQVALLGRDLRAQGLTMAKVKPWAAQVGDYLVTADCRVGIIRRKIMSKDSEAFAFGFELEEVHPVPGRRIVSDGYRPKELYPIQCAFGVRRA